MKYNDLKRLEGVYVNDDLCMAYESTSGTSLQGCIKRPEEEERFED